MDSKNGTHNFSKAPRSEKLELSWGSKHEDHETFEPCPWLSQSLCLSYFQCISWHFPLSSVYENKVQRKINLSVFIQSQLRSPHSCAYHLSPLPKHRRGVTEECLNVRLIVEVQWSEEQFFLKVAGGCLSICISFVSSYKFFPSTRR